MLIYLKMFGRRIVKDFRQKELLPLKLLFFVQASTLFVIYPYLTIHMRELGINVEETAIISAVIPVVAIIMPPVAGLIADRIGNFKILLALFSSLGGLSALLLLTVPVGRMTITYPEEVIIGLSCNPKRPNVQMSLTVHQQHRCDFPHNSKYNTELTIESCGFVCQAFVPENDSIALLETQNYNLHFHDPLINSSNTYKFELPSEKKLLPVPLDEDVRTHRNLKNNDRYKTSIRKLSENSYFFPATGLFNFSCELMNDVQDQIKHNTPNNNMTTTNVPIDVNADSKYYICQFGTRKDVQNASAFRRKFSVGIKPRNGSEDNLENRSTYDVHMVSGKLDDASAYYDTQCAAGFGQLNQHVSVNVPLYSQIDNEKYKDLNLGSCAPRCIATTPRSTMCSNTQTTVEFNMSLTFWSYMAVRVFIAMIGGTAFAMFEGAVIAILRDKKADYGLQRIYASIGGMISSPVSGLLIDYYSQGKDYTDFRPVFYLYAILKVVSGLLMLFINLEFKHPARNVVTDVIIVLKKPELIALFITCFILGTAWGYIESFLFWLLQDLGGTKSLMGFTITIGGVAGIPLLVMSGPIIKRIGHANVIFIGFIFYGIRLLGYSLIYNPWHCLIFEAMESVTSSLSFTAAVTYAAKLSSLNTDTSVQAILGGLYYGVGKGSGSFFGGYLMKLVGTRPTYQIFAAMAVITGIMYFCFNHFCLRHFIDEKQEEVNKEEDDISKDPMEIPRGFVEVELLPDWNMKPNEPTAEDTIEKQNNIALNGHINNAFEQNEKVNSQQINTKDEGIHNNKYNNNTTTNSEISENNVNKPRVTD